MNSSKIKNLFNDRLKKRHEKELGYEVPSDYFETSSKRILAIATARDTGSAPRKRSWPVIWSVAASIALLVTVTIFNAEKFSATEVLSESVADTLNSLIHLEQTLDLKKSNDQSLLVYSLFIEDENLDEVLERQILENIVAETNFELE